MIRLKATSELDGITREFEVAKASLSNWRPFFDDWADMWRESRVTMFDTSGSSTGGKWKWYLGKENRYLQFKVKTYGRQVKRNDVLRWKQGREYLQPSLTRKGAKFNIERISDNEIEVGTSLPYAINHHLGVGRTPEWAGGHVFVKRPILNWGKRLERDTIKLLGRHIGASARDSRFVGLRFQ